MPILYKKQLQDKFEKRGVFSRAELFEFYSEFEPDLKEGTFGWRIYDLKQKNIIKSVGKGIYTLSDKAEYSPLLNKLSKKNRQIADGKLFRLELLSLGIRVA
ncbi:MAG: hypothetical protein HC846_08390 [Blastocatellia bacterium]|nr:hypothetical protein [Blastocatellia bacterium]